MWLSKIVTFHVGLSQFFGCPKPDKIMLLGPLALDRVNNC